MNTAAQEKAETARLEAPVDYYDAPGEMERDSVKRVLAIFEIGGKLSIKQIRIQLMAHYGVDYQDNTIDKAMGILKHHGYDIRKERHDLEGGRYYHTYWLVKDAGALKYDYSASQETTPAPWEAKSLADKIRELKDIQATFPEGVLERDKIGQDIEALESLAQGAGVA